MVGLLMARREPLVVTAIWRKGIIMGDEKVCLLASSSFRLFSDGYQLIWHVGLCPPKMWKAEDSADTGEICLDDAHNNATCLESGAWVSCGAGSSFLIGRPGQPVRVAEMVQAVERYLLDTRRDTNVSRAERYLRREKGTKTGSIGYYGIHPNREPFASTCYWLKLKCL